MNGCTWKLFALLVSGYLTTGMVIANDAWDSRHVTYHHVGGYSSLYGGEGTIRSYDPQCYGMSNFDPRSYAAPSDWNQFLHNVNSTPSPMASPSPGACYYVAPDCVEPAAPVVRPAPTDATGLQGGFEFLWMRANFDQNVAMVIDPPVGNTLVPFNYDYELSPRTWLGWQSCRGSGFRATYFQFDQDADSESVTAVVGAAPVFVYVYGAGDNLSRNAQAVVGQTMTSQHSLDLRAIDLEATQRFRWSTITGVLGGGLRMAQIDQFLLGQVRDGAGVLQEAVSNDLQLSGVGPTLSVQFTRMLAETRLGIYVGARGSMLMSETNQAIYEMKGAFTTELEDRASQREVLTVLEMAIGLQWTQSLNQYSHWFARAAYETQGWFDAGGPVDSHSTIGLDAITLALGVQF